MSAPASETARWGRRRLMVMVALVAVGALAVLSGLGFAVHASILSARHEPVPAVTGAALTVAQDLPAGDARRDAIAATAMRVVSREDTRGGTPATDPAGTITVPGATRLGGADVPTGFPHTSEGAIGQLAALTAAVLQSMSMDTARAVHAQWAMDGAPAFEDWALTGDVQAFLASEAGPYADDPLTSVVLTPVAAQVKGSDGPDWVLACVLMDVTVSVVTQAQAAYGHCERMQWDTDRWVIAEGAAPAAAPSTWPGTQLAAQAGWLTWTSSSQE